MSTRLGLALTAVFLCIENPVAWAQDELPVGANPSWARQAARDALLRDHPGVRFFELGTQTTRVYGPAFSTGGSAEESAANFVQQYAQLFGVPATDLQPGGPLFEGAHSIPLFWLAAENRFRFTMAYYSHQVGGLPVFRSDVRLLIRNEPGFPLVLVSNALRDLGNFQANAAPAPGAFAAAQQAIAAAHPLVTNFGPTEMVVWGGLEDMVVQPAVALKFFGTDGRPNDVTDVKWLFLADAANGAILYEENQILHVDMTGNVKGMATQSVGADICQPEALENLPYARVTIDGGVSGFTDIDGNFVLTNNETDPVTVTSELSGQYFVTNDMAGATFPLAQALVAPGPANFIHNVDNNNEFVRASVNVYRHANIVRDMVVTAHPSYPVIAGQTSFPCNVNINSSCNAFYNGSSINFYRAAGSCSNTGNSDVVHHEYGHHVVATGGSGQGQYGEGTGDCMGVLITDQPILGIGFQNNCAAGIRNADNSMQYPCSGAIHTCGQLISGCVWSTRNQLIVTEPVNYKTILRSLVINAVPLHTGTTIAPDITIDYITLDDDDANPNNGTPHRAEICAGFGAHNMDCPPLPFVTFTYPSGRPAFIDANEVNLVQVNIGAQIDTPLPGTGTLSYRIGESGPFTTVPMIQGNPNEYQAPLPAAACISDIQYYLSVSTVQSGLVSDPADAPNSAFSTTAVSSVEVLYDFQSNPGWTVSGTATDGHWDANPAIPNPAANCITRGSPPADSDGSGQCWVTDNSSASGCNSDVDNGNTILTSQVLDLSGMDDPSVRYARWYSNTGGNAPEADTFVVEVSSNGGANWTTLEIVGPTLSSPNPEVSGGWHVRTFRIADFVPVTSHFQIRFNASDIATQSVVEAAIDAFRVLDCDAGISCTKADVNLDASVDGRDVNRFVALVLGSPGSPTEVCAGDVEATPDGAVGTDDIPNFVTCLLGGGCP